MIKLKTNVISLLSFFILMFTMFAFVPDIKAATIPTEEEAYNAIMSLKSSFPEGMTWTNDNYYAWNGGIYSGGYGCAGFAFRCSDEAFGNLPARKIYDITIADLHVGDILRINNDTHSVVVTKVYSDRVEICEGNFNSSIHWGRILSASAVANSTYMMTRYPEGIFATDHMHQYEMHDASAESNIAYKECTICHDQKTYTTMNDFEIVWWTDFFGTSAISESQTEMNSYVVEARVSDPIDVDDSEISLSSSDTNILAIDGSKITFVGTGEVTLKIYATHRPSVFKSHTFKVSHCFEGDTNVTPATCIHTGIRKGNCRCCGYVEETLPLVDHVCSRYVSQIYPTENLAGRKGHYVCENCSKKFLNSDATEEVTDEDLIIPMLGPRPNSGENTNNRPNSGSNNSSDNNSLNNNNDSNNNNNLNNNNDSNNNNNLNNNSDLNNNTNNIANNNINSDRNDNPSINPGDISNNSSSELPGNEANSTPGKQTNKKPSSVYKDKKGSTYVILSASKKTVCLKSVKKGTKGTVKVPSKITIKGKKYTVTEISKNAFKGSSKITKIILPSSIQKIGANAFYGCKNLKQLEINSKKLTDKSLSAKAFKGISKKTSLKVPKLKRTQYKKLFVKKGLNKKAKIY